MTEKIKEMTNEEKLKFLPKVTTIYGTFQSKPKNLQISVRGS